MCKWFVTFTLYDILSQIYFQFDVNIFMFISIFKTAKSEGTIWSQEVLAFKEIICHRLQNKVHIEKETIS